MCGGISFDGIYSIKILGPKVGRGSGSRMPRDGDGDGKCQEEDGKWVPCPPDVSDGSVINAAGRAIRPIGTPIGERVQPVRQAREPAYSLTETRKKAAEKSKKIAKEAEENVSENQRDAAQSIQDLLEDLVGRPRDERREIKEELVAAIETMFTHDIVGNDGNRYKAEIEEIRIARGDGFTVDGIITDSRGRQIGFFTRTYYQNDHMMEHYEMKLHHEEHQGLGLGSAINARNEELYREMGVRTIRLTGLSTPNGYKGATHWPKNGFNWRRLEDKTEFLSTIRAAIRRYKAAQQNPNNPDLDKADAELFDSMQQADSLMRLLAQAASEPFHDENSLKAGDLLNWPGAEKWFQRARADIAYERQVRNV